MNQKTKRFSVCTLTRAVGALRYFSLLRMVRLCTHVLCSFVLACQVCMSQLWAWRRWGVHVALWRLWW